MSEPRFDEDTVNLGYLNRVLNNETSSTSIIINKHYGTKPNPPYYAGDSWSDGSVVYTCINTRLIGLYNENDWTTESGAKREAESKNKIYLTKPSNYNIGDMWILQSDKDHKAGKKGEILITTVKSSTYNENDWVNMLGYGKITSINEVAKNLNDAINRIGNVEKVVSDDMITTFYQATIPEEKHLGDLWYVTENVETYIKGKLYRYDGQSWQKLDDPEIEKAFEQANEARLIADGKIQSFYSEEEPSQDVGVGDLWIDTNDNNKLYRYNGTNWMPVYDTRVERVIEDLESIIERTVSIETDLGKITQTVSDTEKKVNEEIITSMTELEQSEKDLRFAITKAGGINLIKNSTLEYGFDLYNFIGGSVSLEKNRDVIKNTESKSAIKIIGGSITTQDINILPGVDYTFSCLIYKTDLTNVIVKIISDKVEEYFVKLEPLTWQKFSATFNSSVNSVIIEIICDNNYCYISDRMLNKGTSELEWQRHEGEFRSSGVAINEEGIIVTNSNDNMEHIITSNENKIVNTLNGKTQVTFNPDTTIMKSVDIEEKSTKGKVRETVMSDGTVMVTMDD